MTIEEHTSESRSILVLTGELLDDPGGQGTAELRGALTQLIGRNIDEVVLDVSAVPALHASGLGEIVRAYNTLRRHGSRLRLLGPTPRVERLLEISRVGTVIPVHRTLDQIPAGEPTAA